MSDTPNQSTRSEEIKSSDTNAANKNNHEQRSAPNRRSQRMVIFIYLSSLINMCHIDFSNEFEFVFLFALSFFLKLPPVVAAFFARQFFSSGFYFIYQSIFLFFFLSLNLDKR